MEEKQITIAVAIIRNAEGELLMARRHAPDLPNAHDKWEFIGGGVEFGEDPKETIIREVMEESGLEVNVTKLFPKVFSEILQVPGKINLHVIILTYECKVVGGSLKIGLDAQEEIAELRYLPIEKIKLLDAFKNVHKTIEMLASPND
ncbi:MAG: NUDIX hydrolase [Candidatus Doudnabacteria bacterium]|nr:NUDIX hydrolase [Candidatus Doudnabacteria bacterium]